MRKAYQFNIYRDLANAQPREESADGASELDPRLRVPKFTHNVVMPTAYQKSCWRRMCTAFKFQLRLSKLYESPRMVKPPEKQSLICGTPAKSR